MLKAINVTTLTLILKVKCPKNVTKFRPIACCNTLYKCITKLLSEKLNQILLLEVISESQGAFVAGRSILHNVLICQELVKMYKKKNARPSCMMKLDLKKAYDTISWDFIKQIGEGIGIPRFYVDMCHHPNILPHVEWFFNWYFWFPKRYEPGGPNVPTVICTRDGLSG